jgi:radical SAM protein with 4Fe4S-binding SPASM domain
MLAAKSAKHWIKNFEWWLSMFKKYEMSIDRIMLLEVRNNDWEEEDILEHQKFVKYLVDLTFDFHGGNIENAIDDILMLNQVYNNPDDRKDAYLWGEEMSYIPIAMHDNKGYYGCTISTHMTVRLGDLAICPCHRTAYNKYLYGKFVQDENGKITGIKANNPQMAINILMLNNRNAIMGCDSCIFNKICLGTCRGQSIENSKDPFQNDPKVCNFLKRKYTYLFELLDEKGAMEWLENNLTKYHSAYTSLKYILEIWNEVKKEKKDAELAKFRQNIYR